MTRIIPKFRAVMLNSRLRECCFVLKQSGPQCCANSKAGLTTNDEVASHGS
jgi:hypothetical protein